VGAQELLRGRTLAKTVRSLFSRKQMRVGGMLCFRSG
jgi:hypothetical protein